MTDDTIKLFLPKWFVSFGASIPTHRENSVSSMQELSTYVLKYWPLTLIIDFHL